MLKYYQASTEQDYVDAQTLFKEYAAAINIDLTFQKFEEELTSLQSMYAFPKGGIILVKEVETPVGCVAIRKISDAIGELKRMYVKPGNQKKGIGRELLFQAVELAKGCSYQLLRLDTLNYMDAAIQLYKSAGFYEIPAYYPNPIPTAIYFEKKLEGEKGYTNFG